MYALPLIFCLIGLILYAVLAGADFGAGFWQLTAGRSTGGDRMREHAHHAMAPVWEANHVWLIFVLTVFWTGYPVAFGSIASTLSIALLIAGIGIIFRGATYALRSATHGGREQRATDTVFGLSSVLTPFALGAAAGGIASRRVPVGNAAGNLITSWLNPTSILIGALAVAFGAYIAAVFLTADAARDGEPELVRAFRTRALWSGVVAGALAVGGLVVIRADDRQLFDELIGGRATPAVILSAAFGIAALALVLRYRFEPARYSAAAAVAAVIVGWALAQGSELLPGLTVRQAAAPHDTLVAVVVAIVAGGLLLFPALGWLFRLVLGGRFAGEAAEAEAPAHVAESSTKSASPGLLVRLAGALLIAGIGLTNVANGETAHITGAICLLAFIATAFVAALPTEGALGERPTPR